MKFSLKILLFLLFFVFIVNSPQAMGQFHLLFENPMIGKEAPEFSTLTLSGEILSMHKVRAKKKAIMFFWATWCPHCQTQIKDLNANKETFAKQDIKIILVDSGEIPNAVQAYMSKYNIQMDTFLDFNSDIGKQYNIIGLPTYFLINQEGIITAVEHELPKNYQVLLEKKVGDK